MLTEFEQTEFDRNGFAILPSVFEPAGIDRLIDAVSRIAEDRGVRSRGGVYAIRNLLEVSAPVRQLACSPKVNARVAAHLGAGAFPVRGTLFDKIAGANWLVPWHQDLTICAQIAEERRSRPSVACVACAGDVLLMRPLLVHASSAASQADHRRVIHIDYTSCQLDGGLRWLTT